MGEIEHPAVAIGHSGRHHVGIQLEGHDAQALHQHVHVDPGRAIELELLAAQRHVEVVVKGFDPCGARSSSTVGAVQAG